MKSPRPPIFFYAAFICAIALVALWFEALFLVPKIDAMLREVHEPLGFPLIFSALYQAVVGIPGFVPIVVVLFLAAFLAGTFERVPQGLAALARHVMIIASVIFLILAFTFGITIFLGWQRIYLAESLRIHIYETALEEFSLKEAAEGRFAQVQKNLADLHHMKPVEVKSASVLSPSDQKSRVIQMAKMLQTPASPEMKKQILATLYLFRTSIEKNSRIEDVILTAAKEQTGREFPDTNAFYTWLQPSIGKENWTPLPIYRFEIFR
jgi:hypothetical protein